MLTKTDIKLIRSLGDKSGRTASGLFVVEGRKMVGEALASGFTVERLFTAESPDAVLDAVLPERCLHGDAMVETVSRKEMERISMLKTPSDMLAVVRIPHHDRLTPQAAGERLILALDDIQDPGNLGTIIRTADWFGIGDIVCSPATADCYNPKVVQATMGALFRVRLHYSPLAEFLARMSGGAKNEDDSGSLPVYGTFLDGGNIYDTELSQTGVIVMGNEGRGISDAVLPCISHRLYIPPYPSDRCGSESLNVAVATAIICSEFRRRRRPTHGDSQ